MEFTVSTQQDDYNISASVRRIGKDWLVAIWGGDQPHIGAVGMAQARPSLDDPNRSSATASVFCDVGHKEDELVKKVSEQLAARLDARVVVTAGLHWDRIPAEGIARVRRNVVRLVALIEARIDAAENKAGQVP